MSNEIGNILDRLKEEGFTDWCDDIKTFIDKLIKDKATAIRLLVLIHGCFEAANIEGLNTILLETEDERLKDLLVRRILYPCDQLNDYIKTLPPAAMQSTGRQEGK